MATLTPKQEEFVRQYLIDLNATRAAIRAGYSRKAARQQGAENLSKPVIKAAIKQAKAERAERKDSIKTRCFGSWQSSDSRICER
jgi:phage terminase small subunit